ncbi:MAG TPA: EamA family transporter [Candidatus Eisenbacteria bacterium]|nr:EamA family transporter [Candidatus Eisenbacteria bacterium]
MAVARRPTRTRLEVLLGALAFAASVPAGKLLLRGLAPLALSGGLYLAAGALCAALLALQSRRQRRERNRLQGREWWWLLLAIAFGGVLGPLALFHGLRLTSGHVAGLLLNFEAVFTVALGAVLSRERVGARGAQGIGLVIGSAVLLAATGEPHASAATRPLGPLLIVAACACWGLDNNFTQHISLRDARQIVALKGLIGGAASVSMAAAFGQLGGWSAGTIAAVVCVGAVSYGVSIVLFIRGLRALGVIHTGALFALAPGFAAVLSWLVLREPIHAGALLALAGMTGGALLLATDVHAHEHVHEALEHAHPHEHDAHHQHAHTPEQLDQAPHAHWHRHEPLVHRHEHSHDLHHRHRH